MSSECDMLGSYNGSQRQNVILLAEGDNEVRASLSELLSVNGYEVLKARTGFDALVIASEYGKNVDLLISDLNTPVIDGRTLARIMIKEKPNVKLMFMSGFEIPELGPDEGLDAVLIQKPFDGAVLLREVRRILPVANNQA